MLSKEAQKLAMDKNLSSRINELGKHYIDLGMTINFHKNFRDLNPVYHKQRHERALKVADRYL